MDYSKATKQQLLQIAIDEHCPVEFKYRACSELQMRWTEDMLTEVVIMYGKGYKPKEIAEYLGVSREMIGGIVSKYNLKRARNGTTKIIINKGEIA
jgi:hypothetical protein